jgi:branched-subunit amino acid aminotransferase/4-amino-4-deoxychorismate lyase
MQKKILDSFKIENGKISYKLQHCQRTQEALAFLNKNISLDKILEIYEKLERSCASENAKHEKVFRLTIDPDNIETPLLETRNLDPLPEVVRLHTKKITENLSKERQFKWSDRSYWDELLKNLPSGCQDVLLYDSEDQAIETARCNLYLYDSGLDMVLTPKLDVGCLNGVLRRALLAEGAVDLPQLGYKKIVEQNIVLSDLKHAPNLYIGNAVRGLLKASLT